MLLFQQTSDVMVASHSSHTLLTLLDPASRLMVCYILVGKSE